MSLSKIDQIADHATTTNDEGATEHLIQPPSIGTFRFSPERRRKRARSIVGRDALGWKGGVISA